MATVIADMCYQSQLRCDDGPSPYVSIMIHMRCHFHKDLITWSVDSCPAKFVAVLDKWDGYQCCICISFLSPFGYEDAYQSVCLCLPSLRWSLPTLHCGEIIEITALSLSSCINPAVLISLRSCLYLLSRLLMPYLDTDIIPFPLYVVLLPFHQQSWVRKWYFLWALLWDAWLQMAKTVILISSISVTFEICNKVLGFLCLCGHIMTNSMACENSSPLTKCDWWARKW